MAKHDDFELRVVEVAEPLLSRPLSKPLSKLSRQPAPTPGEALEALRATKGAAPLFERIPTLGDVSLWSEVAYWNVCKTSGAALGGGAFLWGCDFLGSYWALFDAQANCIAYFAGNEDLGGIFKPNVLDGRVWCYMDTLVAGYYVFVAQVQTYPDQSYPDYVATVKFGINGQPLGLRALFQGSSVYLPFVLNLPAGVNRFEINQHTGGLFFRGLTAFQLLIPPVVE